ncbi:hypothetical protein DY000_02005344 [Brassica cretica]|uniref:Uncharacterized protein n=1 Tax=Brassica cretica TaxID=69181 RepID=A0ABQ7C0K3_BRACR|nr:hypothetical protein DY000_02005344 [Brassica cretica]
MVLCCLKLGKEYGTYAQKHRGSKKLYNLGSKIEFMVSCGPNPGLISCASFSKSSPTIPSIIVVIRMIISAAAGKHSEDDGTISIDRLPHRHSSREHSEKREHERDYIDDNDQEEVFRSRKRGEAQATVTLSLAAALNNSGGQKDGWRLQESCLRYHHNA